jgi:exodeoxyribonuclease VII small subunit
LRRPDIPCVRSFKGIINVAKKPENLSFEESLVELERIVAELEQGDVSLDDALKQFERGINLVRNSQAKLEQAQQKVAILLKPDENAPLSPYAVEGE